MSSTDPVEQLSLRTAGVPALLAEHYGLTLDRIEPGVRGYTNQSLLIECGGVPFVLRFSWPGKPADQLSVEERVLLHLERLYPELPVPRLVQSRTGANWVHWSGQSPPCAVHLFRRLPGELRYTWRGPCGPEDARAAGAVLAQLHAALATIPVPAVDPLAPLRRRLAGLQTPAPLWMAAPLVAEVTDGFALFLERAQGYLESLGRLVAAAPLCWVHGDFHPENVLYSGAEVAGVVDFDTVRVATSCLDLAVGLFSFARDASREDRLVLRAGTVRAMREGYGAAAEALGSLDPWLKLFALDQALLHLDCARRGIWELAGGIGFLPCFREVLAP